MKRLLQRGKMLTSHCGTSGWGINCESIVASYNNGHIRGLALPVKCEIEFCESCARGESWGSHQHSLEKGTADAHGALGSVVGSRRVCGQGQSVGAILPAPLFEGGLSRQALSPNATGKRQRVRTSVPPPDLRSGLLGGTGPWVPAESSIATSLPTGGEAHRGPPGISGGVTVPQTSIADTEGCGVQAGVGSHRTAVWKVLPL